MRNVSCELSSPSLISRIVRRLTHAHAPEAPVGIPRAPPRRGFSHAGGRAMLFRLDSHARLKLGVAFLPLLLLRCGPPVAPSVPKDQKPIAHRAQEPAPSPLASPPTLSDGVTALAIASFPGETQAHETEP